MFYDALQLSTVTQICSTSSILPSPPESARDPATGARSQRLPHSLGEAQGINKSDGLQPNSNRNLIAMASNLTVPESSAPKVPSHFRSWPPKPFALGRTFGMGMFLARITPALSMKRIVIPHVSLRFPCLSCSTICACLSNWASTACPPLCFGRPPRQLQFVTATS